MPTWNDQQLRAIQTKEKNILVSASAGSGKTTVLIARLMDLVLKDRISIDAILAMTFTEAAANEMKKRLAAELQIAYQTCQKEDKAYITKQLTGIQNAHISTIHSFCLSIIQEYYYTINLDPASITNILDNGTMAIYQTQALKQAFAIQYQLQDSMFIELCQMMSTRPENDDSLYRFVRTLASLASSKSDAEQWLQQVCDTYHMIQHLSDIPQEIRDSFFSYLHVEYERYQEMLLQVQELYRTRYESEAKKRALVDTIISALPPLKEALRIQDYEGFRSAMAAVAHVVVPPSPDKGDKIYASLRKGIQDLEDRLLGLLFSEDQFLRDMNQLYPYIRKLVAICRDYRRCYATIKTENSCIDFDDMEHFALQILQKNDGQVAQNYRDQFQEIMVDEFQDSNDVQNLLVTLICRKNNVFRVGDIKQSIYGFRHAKPQLMRGLIDARSEHDEVIYLSNNYRSKKMIVDFNNVLFKRLMNIDGFACSYTKEDDVATGVSSQNEQNVPICFHAIFHDEIKQEYALTFSKNECKASYIAAQIIEIRERKQRSWKDFVVLVRSNARKDNLKAAFDELNIPYFIDVKSGFYQSPAVRTMLSTLRALLEPDNDIAFVACMMSPLFKQTPELFAQAKLAKEKKQSYYRFTKEHPFPGFEHFLQLRATLYTTSLKEILTCLYEFQNYYALYTTMQDKTNLDLLFDKACAFEQKTASGVSAFLAQIEQIKDEQTAEAIPIGAEADVVRVMSIHQSKGLQFPVVFLWSTSTMSPVEFKDLCICDADMGIALKCMDLPERFVRTTIPRIAMEHKKDREELEEEMRILYVATTRAQQQMHIVDCVLSLEHYRTPLTMSAIYQRGGYTSWILQSFLQDEDPLFTLKEVHTLWQACPQPAEPTSPIQTPTYTKPVSTTALMTASAIKAEDDDFSFEDTRKATTYGTQMHRMIERLAQQEWTYPLMQQIAQQIAFPLTENDMQRLSALYHNPLFHRALQDVCYYELPFMAKVQDTVLHGFIDFMAMQEDHILIIDFKSDTLSQSEAFIQRYHEQLETYRLAMEVLYPSRTIQTFIYSLHLGEMIEVL